MNANDELLDFLLLDTWTDHSERVTWSQVLVDRCEMADYHPIDLEKLRQAGL